MQHDVPAVQLDASFKTVIQRITSGCQGMVMVEDAEGGLAGIITDGDLRRFMERGFSDIRHGCADDDT